MGAGYVDVLISMVWVRWREVKGWEEGGEREGRSCVRCERGVGCEGCFGKGFGIGKSRMDWDLRGLGFLRSV